MSKTRVIRSICFENDVFRALEAYRGNEQHVRSSFINQILREKLGLPKKERKKGGAQK